MQRFREIFTPKQLYLIHEAFHAGIASVTDFTAQPSTTLLLENWLDASITENGEFVVADELKRVMDELESEIMRITPKEKKIVTSSPYFNIVFGCGNRAFYDVKNDLYELAEKIGIEIEDGYISEHCDYEGDLEEIVIYDGARDKLLRDSVLEFYGYDKKEADGMAIKLTIF